MWKGVLLMGEWDNKFKRLFARYPEDFARWLADAELLEELNPHLPGRNIDADALMRARRREREILVHIECQRRVERTKTGRRMWEYNVMATVKYHLPVLSYVLYLKREERIAASPYEIKLSDDEVIHRFHFASIELYNISTEELRQHGGLGALPLLPLTRDGARREVVDDVIRGVQQQVQPKDRDDLLGISLAFASLAFEREEDQLWLVRRFAMLDDILNETPFVKYLEQRGEARGEARGEQHGREIAFKEALLSILSARFPELVSVAQERLENLKDTEVLNKLIVQISVAQTVEEARQHILAAGQVENT